MSTKQQERFFGAHVSVSGGLESALARGEELNINTIQVHPSAPQRWNTAPYPKGVEDAFLAARETSTVKRVFFHAIYLINLANPDAQKFHLAKTSLVNYLDLLSRIGGDGVIVHVGSMKDQPDENAGYDQVAKGIDWVLEKTKENSRLILEVAAGSGDIIGDRVEELATIYDRVSNKDRVGFALDTQHMWASGYDLQGDLEGVLGQVDKYFGFNKVWAIHLNDSKTALGSKKDRHENLGQGLIGKEAITSFVRHPLVRSIPLILETPGLKDMDTAKDEVEALRAIL